jgi:transposase
MGEMCDAVIGMDIGKERSYLKAIDSKSQKVIREGFVVNTPGDLKSFINDVPGAVRVVMEATGNFGYLHDVMEAWVDDIQVAHPLMVKAIASAKIKTDKIDAGILAKLGVGNLVPEAYCPPREVRDRREVLRHRAFLVAMQTRIKNRIHAALWKLGVTPPEVTDLFGGIGRAWLEGLTLRKPHDEILKEDLRLLGALQEEIRAATRAIEKMAKADERVEWLTSIRGMGVYSAMLALAEIGEIERFDNPKKLVAYAGLCPSTYQSGRVLRHGAITKQGSKWLRWVMVECCQRYAKAPGRLGNFYRRLAKKSGTRTARVATARALLTGIFYCLKKKEPFRENG